MTDPEQVPVEHDLPEALRAAVAADTGALAAVYNGLQEMTDETFETVFGDSLATLADAVAGVEARLVVVVLGLDLEDDPTTQDLVVGARVLSVHVPDEEGAVTDLLHVADAGGVPDDVLGLPIPPTDCPPGSGRHAADMDVETYREVVAAMAHQRFDLLQTDLDSYAASYVRPMVRGLEAYADA